ncbi:MAG TPA: polysaccharide biosynthesis/export family protein [Nitrospirales bacterium]|nr:polysaccharide biosynthesis/export family protein [Nitrospirales bacterium]
MKGVASRVGGRVVTLAVLMLFGTMFLWTGVVWAQLGPAGSTGSPKQNAKSDHAEKTEKDSLIVTSEYYIGPEDVLEIIVWRNQDLSKVVTVRPDGRISLPLLGDIEATGLTPAELTANIVNRLKQFKETPTVSVVVQQVNSYGIFVLGEVTKPGRLFLKSKTTLLQSITMAGGFTPIAARNKIVIFRFGEGKNSEIRLKASYDDIVLRDGQTQNYVLKPGDTIVVPAETMVMTQ